MIFKSFGCLISLRVNPDGRELLLRANPVGAESNKTSIPQPCVKKVVKQWTHTTIRIPDMRLCLKKRGKISRPCIFKRPKLWALVLCGRFGLIAGSAINPARDLSPRILSALAGWPQTFSVSHFASLEVPILLFLTRILTA